VPKPLVFHGEMPTECGNGHYYGPGTYLLGWMPCQCAGGRGHHWLMCEVPGCGDVKYVPAHDPAVKAKMWD
jgi:hypothetical protein